MVQTTKPVTRLAASAADSGSAWRRCRSNRRLDHLSRKGLFELKPGIRDVSHTTCAILLKTAREHPPDGQRCVRRQRRPVRLGANDSRDGVRHLLTLEDTRSGQHLVENGSERPDVRPRVHRLSPRLLR